MIDSENILKDLTLRLKKVRDEKQLLDLANNSGMSYSWMKSFLNGYIRDPRLKTIEALLKALDAWEEKNGTRGTVA